MHQKCFLHIGGDRARVSILGPYRSCYRSITYKVLTLRSLSSHFSPTPQVHKVSSDCSCFNFLHQGLNWHSYSLVPKVMAQSTSSYGSSPPPYNAIAPYRHYGAVTPCVPPMRSDLIVVLNQIQLAATLPAHRASLYPQLRRR